MTLIVMAFPAMPVTSKDMSNYVPASLAATGQDGGWAWQCCNIAESPHGCACVTNCPMWCPQNLAGQIQSPRSQLGRQISWSGCWPVWRWVLLGGGELR